MRRMDVLFFSGCGFPLHGGGWNLSFLAMARLLLCCSVALLKLLCWLGLSVRLAGDACDACRDASMLLITLE